MHSIHDVVFHFLLVRLKETLYYLFKLALFIQRSNRVFGTRVKMLNSMSVVSRPANVDRRGIGRKSMDWLPAVTLCALALSLVKLRANQSYRLWITLVFAWTPLIINGLLLVAVLLIPVMFVFLLSKLIFIPVGSSFLFLLGLTDISSRQIDPHLRKKRWWDVKKIMSTGDT